MYCYDFTKGTMSRADHIEKPAAGARCFITCFTDEITSLAQVFGFDDDTLADCLNFDENIRLTSYGGYDFTSLIYFTLNGDHLHLSEVNLYAGHTFLIAVFQQNDGAAAALEERIRRRITAGTPGQNGLNRLYYTVFDILLTDMSETLERVEDQMTAFEKHLGEKVDKANFHHISEMRETVYLIRRHLRPLLYVGDQLLVNENGLVAKDNIRFFHNIDVRINKLFDFSQSLAEYSHQLSTIYDSRLTVQTNDVINKLTVITLFFGPMTVITGIYGMNFVNMPTLQQEWGYPFALGLMALITLVIYIVLRRKKWI